MIIDYIKNLSLVEIVTYLGFILTLIGFTCYTYKIKVLNRNKISQKSIVKNGVSVQAGGNVHMEGINESKSNSKE